MAIIQCSHGHYYDDSKSDFCPMCRKAAGNQIADQIDRMLSLTSEGDLEQQEIVLTEAGVKVVCDPEKEKRKQ